MTHRKAELPRGGFTLVELLVVISIIGLLMALLLPAVQKIRSRGEVVKASAQINNIANACTQFKTDVGVFPPDNPTDAAACFRLMYPRFNGANPTIPNNPNAIMLLFLQGPNGTGWAVDQPVAPGTTATTKKGPWGNFQATEISGGQLIDPWERPLQYRASGSGGAYSSATPPGGIPFYLDTSGKAFNYGGVQVISGGPNKQMGSGGSLPLSGNPGFDDLANFNSGYQLGARP